MPEAVAVPHDKLSVCITLTSRKYNRLPELLMAAKPACPLRTTRIWKKASGVKIDRWASAEEARAEIVSAVTLYHKIRRSAPVKSRPQSWLFLCLPIRDSWHAKQKKTGMSKTSYP